MACALYKLKLKHIELEHLEMGDTVFIAHECSSLLLFVAAVKHKSLNCCVIFDALHKKKEKKGKKKQSI